MTKQTTPSKTPAAQAAATVAKPAFDAAAVKAQAVALCAADRAFENGLLSVATAVARILTDKPSFDLWEAVSAAFVADYKAARGCEDKTAANRWLMVAAEMRARFALEKPAKGTEGSAKKAKQREQAAKAVEKIVKAHKGNAADILKAAQAAGPAQVATYAKAAEVAAKAAEVAATKAAKGTEAKLRERIGKAAGAASGAVLQAMAEACERILAEAKAKKPATAADAAALM